MEVAYGGDGDDDANIVARKASMGVLYEPVMPLEWRTRSTLGSKLYSSLDTMYTVYSG